VFCALEGRSWECHNHFVSLLEFQLLPSGQYGTWVSLVFRLLLLCLRSAAHIFGHTFLALTPAQTSYRQILQSYDSRYRKTDRSPEIYQNPDCAHIDGGQVETIVELPEHDTVGNAHDLFWSKSKERGLLVIAVPYKKGEHVAKTPMDFLPVIDQLQQLHDSGYVHRDIRAFNTVFSGETSGLIDFDFGGKPGKRYPAGYRTSLNDGTRCGRESKTLEYWHDWYALVRLIVDVHLLEPHPKEELNIGLDSRWNNAMRQGKRIGSETSPEEIAGFIGELRLLLQDLAQEKWIVRPCGTFQDELDMIMSDPTATRQGATGSPPKKLSRT